MSLVRVRATMGSDRARGGPAMPGTALLARQTGIISTHPYSCRTLRLKS